MQKFTKNVLILPGGTENALEIKRSLQDCKEITLFSASSDTPNQAFYAYKENHILPTVDDPDFLVELNTLVVAKKIDVIFPSNSKVIDALLLHRDSIQCDCLLPSSEVVSLTRSKRSTIEILQDAIPTPTLYRSTGDVSAFPVFVKPDSGYGSQDAYRIDDKQALSKIDFDRYIVQEFLPGREYTIDCLSNNDSHLLFASGRERARIRMGTSMHCEEISNELQELFTEYANRILEKIPITGHWFFQLKENANKQLVLLEIDIRIAGTMCFNRCKGVNFPLLSLYLFYGHSVDILTNKVPMTLDRCLKNSYSFDYEYDKVYIDLDDTIIVRGKINLAMILFLYQCVNNKKRIILLSKNLMKDKIGYLSEFRIKEVFDEIIWLREDDRKTVYIDGNKSIFIDDSFSQRKEVADTLGIPTFDCSMIECLLDERI